MASEITEVSVLLQGLEPLARKLALHSPLTRSDREALLAMPFERRHVRARTPLFRASNPASHCCVLLDGYGARSKLQRDGSRQIVDLLFRGDLIGVRRTLFQHADHDVEVLTDGIMAVIAARDLEKLLANHPNIARAIWSETLLEGAIQREWTVNVGRRSATARLAHLLCEIGVRHEQYGLSSRHAFEFRLTQSDMADCAGLTPVHVNRVLRSLRESGLVRRVGGRVTIEDWAGLVRLAGFDERYLLGEDDVSVRRTAAEA